MKNKILFVVALIVGVMLIVYLTKEKETPVETTPATVDSVPVVVDTIPATDSTIIDTLKSE